MFDVKSNLFVEAFTFRSYNIVIKEEEEQKRKILYDFDGEWFLVATA